MTATWKLFESVRTQDVMKERRKELTPPKLKTNQLHVDEIMSSAEVKTDTQKEISTKETSSDEKVVSKPIEKKEKEKKKIPMSDIKLMTMDEWAMESFKR